MTQGRRRLREIVRDAVNAEKEERKARRKRTPSKIVQLPHCKGCGTAVPEGVLMCDVCAAKAGRAPEPFIQTAPQRVPAYMRPKEG